MKFNSSLKTAITEIYQRQEFFFYIKEFSKLNFNFIFVTHKFSFFFCSTQSHIFFWGGKKKCSEKSKLLHVVLFSFIPHIVFYLQTFFFLYKIFIYQPNNIQYDMISPHCDVSYVTIVTKRYILYFLLP